MSRTSIRPSAAIRAFCLAALAIACHAPLTAEAQAAGSVPPTVAQLATQFAPAVLLAGDEPNYPANVEWFLARTLLSVHDGGCSPSSVGFGAASIAKLQTSTYTSPCGGHVIRASGTRSADRSHTFVLEDVSDSDKSGPRDPSDWQTYFHAFKNKLGGTNLQYWFFYPFNTGEGHFGIQFGFHGGDWEMFEIMLDASNAPVKVAMTGHTSIDEAPWSNVTNQNGHPRIYAERGGHEVHLTAVTPPPHIVNMTWPGSVVLFPGLTPPKQHGALVDVGSRLHPLVGFLGYSGLWGSLGSTSISSGYWGPPFNETGLGADSFLTAWCYGIDDPQQSEAGRKECYPDDVF